MTITHSLINSAMQVTLQVDKDSKEAAKAAEQASKPAVSGLDAFLAELEKKKKVWRLGGWTCSRGVVNCRRF